MKQRKIILLTSLLLAYNTIAFPQIFERYNSFSYNVNEGLLQSNVADIAFDRNNFCWVSFANGIQKFNGKTFTSISIQPGLPDDKWASFFNCSNGDLLISHSQGISRYDISNNSFKLVFRNSDPKNKPAVFIGEDNGAVYLYTYDGFISAIDINHYQTVSKTNTGFPSVTPLTYGNIKFSNNIIRHKVAMMINYTMYIWDLQNKKPVHEIPDNIYTGLYFIHLISEHEILHFNTKENGQMLVYDFNSAAAYKTRPLINQLANSGRASIFPWREKLLFSINNRVYETDSSLENFSKELVNFQNQPIAGNSTIVKIKEDNFGNLYLVTINAGFKKIIRNNYPIKYYGTEKKEDNYTLSVLPDKQNNRILAGTYGNGLLVFDSLQHLTKHIRTLPGSTTPFSITSMVKTGQDEYLLFLTGEKYIWKLGQNLSKLTRHILVSNLPANKSGIHYFSNVLYQNKQQVFVQTQGNIYKLNLYNNHFIEHNFANAYIMSGIFYNGNILTHANDELLFLDTATFAIRKRIAFNNTGLVRCFEKDKQGNIYIGSNKGIFKIDSTGKIEKHITLDNGIPDECIYAMALDEHGSLWCSTNKGLFNLNRQNSILQLKKEDGLQENEFNTNTVASTPDGELFFGGINGISSFYPSAINNFEEHINLLVTGIRINNEKAFTDTAVWNINTIDLPHNENLLSFDFIAMANNNPGQYSYQYKMEGIDKEWIPNNELQTLRYLLPPGKYVLKLYASRYFDKNAVPLKEIKIIIHPPYWKTWWFRIGVSLLLLATLVYIINQYNRQQFKRKLLELQSEHKLQLERERISRDLHDSIGAYANAVLYKTDLLQKEEVLEERAELMKDLKFASKDIIISLRETIWALKKEHYTAEECLMRIRNFIQPFNRYYPAIQFKVEGEASPSLNLDNTRALNLVRIVQEAVTNAIKHSGALHITVSSQILPDKWKLVIADDGKGYDHQGMNELQEGNGLENMRQRVLDAGFKLTLESAINKGTIITIFV